jgi:hypothetical protein
MKCLITLLEDIVSQYFISAVSVAVYYIELARDSQLSP